MKKAFHSSLGVVLSCVLFLLSGTTPVFGQSIQRVTAIDPAQSPPSGGNGDSWAPILSPGARYVLFASAANNLCLAANNNAIPALIPRCINVYLRDRTNATTTLVSVNIAGVAGGNGNSWPVALSTNGQFALFESSASDLVPSDTNNATDIFVRDLINRRTLLISAGTNGVPGNGTSDSSTMTPDGRYVAFVSTANNLVYGKSNALADIFVRDLQSNLTGLVSVDTFATNSDSRAPEITSDGRYVAFCGALTNTVSTVGSVIYLRDLFAGTTLWASAYARTAYSSNGLFCFNHALSADGRYLAYESSGNSTQLGKLGPGTFGIVFRFNLASGVTEVVDTNAAVSATPIEDIRSLDISPDGRFIAFIANTNGITGATTCVQLWDGLTGDLKLASGDPNGSVQSNSICYWPTVDPTGQFIGFLSTATNLSPSPLLGNYHLYLHDRLGNNTTLLDAGTNGVGSPVSAATVPRFSPDFHFLAFESADAALVPNDCNHDSDVFLRDLGTGVNELISARDPNLPSLTPDAPSAITSSSLSSNGQFLVFASEADNLLLSDANGCRDIFVRDLVNGTNFVVSIATNGASADSDSSDPSISPDGRYVAFTSRADNLVPGDNNRALDVFLRDLQTGTCTLVSFNTNGTGPGNYDSYAPTVSSGGRYILFRSRATNLAPASFTSMSENLFLADEQTPAIYALTTGGDLYDLNSNCEAAMTPDGRFVVFGTAQNALYVWDSAKATRIYTNALYLTPNGLAISADGNYIGFSQGGLRFALLAANVATGSTWVVETNNGAFVYRTPQLSADGRYLTCVKNSTPAGTNVQVYLFDVISKTNLLVSQSDTASTGANGNSDTPCISLDARFITYRSVATNLVAGDLNGLPDIFLFDRLSGSTRLLSASQLGAYSANHRSLNPVLSADSRTLLFASWASDLSPGDFNNYSDLFTLALPSGGPGAAISVVVLPPAPGENPWLVWPTSPGASYRAQFKNNLDEPVWQNLKGGIIWFGNQAYFQDPSPNSLRRFYRIVQF